MKIRTDKKMIVDIEQEDFGMLCACAIRYCQGRETYMTDGKHYRKCS